MLHDQIDWSDSASVARARDNLRRRLSRRYSHIDEHLLEASIEDALLHHERCPEGFDKSRGASLYYYLELWTRHYLDKRLQKVKRRRKHEKAVGVADNFFERIVSEVRARRGINIGKSRTEQEDEVGPDELERRKEVLDALVTLLNPHDRAGVELLRTGAAHEECVRHLGIDRLPRKEQQRKINTEKDRLKKKLKRRVEKMEGE